MITPEKNPDFFECIPISCVICGSFAFNQCMRKEKLGNRILTQEVLGITEHRCNTCRSQFGEHGDMEKFYNNNFGQNWEDFRQCMTDAGHKAQPFTRICVSKKPDIILHEAEAAHISSELEKIKDEYELRNKTDDDKVKALKDALKTKSVV